MDPSGWHLFDHVITEGRFGIVLELRDVFLVPKIRLQNQFCVAIISILDTDLQLHRYTNMVSKRRHNCTAAQK